MTGLRNRDIPDKLAMIDIGDMETLVLRAREQESLFLGFSGFGMWNRLQNQMANRRAMTNEEIRNLIKPKFEPFYQQGRPQQQPQMNTVENLRRHEKSFMPMQMRISQCCNQEGHIRRNCPNRSRNVQNDYYRLNFDPNSPENRSTSVNRNVSFNNRANANNVEFLIDTGIKRTLINGEIWDIIKEENNLIKGHKGSFTTANGQPLEVMGKVKTKLKIGMNEVELDVFVANYFKHDCLVGLDFMGIVEGNKTKIKEMILSLGGEEVPTENSKKQSVNTVEFTDEEQKVMQEFLDHNRDMFASSMKELGCCNYTVHSIDTQGSEPIREPPRRVPFHMKEEIKKQLDELLEAGIIEPSNSEWATALVPIKKKTGGIRLCIDFR
ncbi:unnamed protein product [Brachionus calyciflorus]|uniref:Uncharacterized protein n=1 Tax=Brachionus calyciflorus TaxID=104777 RepID=A0A814BH00_9BILA|nr:unnamed protein product [Brachionus calyciflorus]